MNAGDTPAATVNTRLSERRWSVRAHAPDQFYEGRSAGRSGIERRRRKQNFWRRENCNRVEDKVDLNKIDNRWCQDLCRRCRDGAQNFTALASGGLRLRVRRLGMERTTALSRIGRRCDRAERAVIGNRDPRTNRQRDDHATPGCLHTPSIADAMRMLKCFLFDP